MNTLANPVATSLLADTRSPHAAAGSTTYAYTTDAAINSLSRGNDSAAAANGAPLMLTEGQVFETYTDPAQTWRGRFTWKNQEIDLTNNADGSDWNSEHPPIGALVGIINGKYKVIGAGQKTLTAWATGELKLVYWDWYYGVSEGSITTTINVASNKNNAILARICGGIAGVFSASKKTAPRRRRVLG